MNLPNKLTITRILLIPVFTILLINGYKFFAIVTFGLASITDALDGIIAKARDQRTRLGFFLDPIADKLLINTSFITLAIMKLIPNWVAIIVMSRDVIIVLGVMAIFMVDEKLIICPTFISKSTTTAQMVTILIALLNQWAPKLSLVLWFSVWITAFLTIVSGLHYIFLAAGIFNGQA